METHKRCCSRAALREQSSAAKSSTAQGTAQNAQEQRTQAARALEAVACLDDSSVSKSREEGKFGGIAVALNIKGLQNVCQFFLAVLLFLRKGPSESAAETSVVGRRTQAQKSTPPRKLYYLVKLSLPGGGKESGLR